MDSPLIPNYGISLPRPGMYNPFVYGYNGMGNRTPSPISKHSVGSYGSIEHLSILMDKILGLSNSYLPPVQNYPRIPTSPPMAAYRDTNIWCGELPPRTYGNPIFSPKVFIGGIPWDISEQSLLDAFLPYGRCQIEWPTGNLRGPKALLRNVARPKASGFVYVVFETEQSVRALLQDCAQSFGSAGELYFRLRTRRNRTTEYRQVQVIPWVTSDAYYIPDNIVDNKRTCRDVQKTVFVGALHGMMTASVLGAIMDDVFGPVVHVAINTDKNKYPIGSGRVTFADKESYDRAVACEFLEIRTSKFCKKIQIDPFLEDSNCSTCDGETAPFFCRHKDCLKYLCNNCWQAHFANEDPYASKHRALIHNIRRTSSNSHDDTASSTGGPCVQLMREESTEST